jgi:arylsulfatase A-like enzyme
MRISASQVIGLAASGLLVQGSCLPKEKISKIQPPEHPNIVVILADDLGFGDTGCYGSVKIRTPNIDRLAASGLRFTNGYCTSATSTPSRFALLTGQYPWRNERARILPGDAPLLIDPATVTLPAMLRNAGYTTGIVGKWHLGLGSGRIDWNRRISPGPNETGFDYSYIMAATNDRCPTVFMENGTVVGLDPADPIEVSYKQNFPGEPTGKDNPGMIRMGLTQGHAGTIVNGVSRIGFMKGGTKARWTDENMVDTFLLKAQKFVESNKTKPFFLYYALHEPHCPRIPSPRFAGVSGLGARGDVIAEADWAVGEFMKKLDQLGLTENTLIVFSSDNGPVLDDGYADQAVGLNGTHTPWGPMRGGKYSLLEAGTHVPFLVSWPGYIKPGVSEALVCQVDLAASFAALAGQPNPGADSQNILDALLGRSQSGRSSLILENGSGRTLIRENDWVMIPSYPGEPLFKEVNIETGFSPVIQLYNLKTDPGQRRNLAGQEKERVLKMKEEASDSKASFDF